jgi:hypothetical protein
MATPSIGRAKPKSTSIQIQPFKAQLILLMAIAASKAISRPTPSREDSMFLRIVCKPRANRLKLKEIRKRPHRRRLRFDLRQIVNCLKVEITGRSPPAAKTASPDVWGCREDSKQV